jgi:hypothetical protein
MLLCNFILDRELDGQAGKKLKSDFIEEAGLSLHDISSNFYKLLKQETCLFFS